MLSGQRVLGSRGIEKMSKLGLRGIRRSPSKRSCKVLTLTRLVESYEGEIADKFLSGNFAMVIKLDALKSAMPSKYLLAHSFFKRFMTFYYDSAPL